MWKQTHSKIIIDILLGKHGSAHVDRHGLQGIVTVSYKTYRDTYRNIYQISQYSQFFKLISIHFSRENTIKIWKQTHSKKIIDILLGKMKMLKCSKLMSLLNKSFWIHVHGYNLDFNTKTIYLCTTRILTSISAMMSEIPSTIVK
jgi:hypothetical protein